jgi:phage host-nuclease inhibitor protein Gam
VYYGHLYQHRVLKTVQQCEVACEYTEYSIQQMGDIRRDVLRLLRDCADICTLTAKYISRCSYFTKPIALLCAEICEVCGNHCLHNPDELLQRCGQMCLHCANECRVFAMSA